MYRVRMPLAGVSLTSHRSETMTIEVHVTNKGSQPIIVKEVEPDTGKRNMERDTFEREHEIAPGEVGIFHIYELRDLKVEKVREKPPGGVVR